MQRDFMLRVRLSEGERDKLKAACERVGLSMSEFVRDYVKSLPDVDSGKSC